jgi:hypothetical protein
VKVLDEFCLDASLIAVRWFDALGRTLIFGLVVAQLQHSNLHVVVRVDFVLALLDGLHVAGGLWRKFHRGLHLELLLFAHHEASLVLPLTHPVGENQVLDWCH